MKIVIPMAGQGKRFLAAGYTTPKPLIEVDGMPIVEHVVRNFDTEHDEFLFGINEAHLKDWPLEKTLGNLVNLSEIVSMPYQKAGPIGVLRNLESRLQQDEPVIVNYCDFSWQWDYNHFRETVQKTGCDGAVVCYTGFHPHLLGPNKYATLEADGHWMKTIREKHSWHENKQDDWTSSGTYYFKSTRALMHYCKAIEQKPDWKINDEFYVSQLYQLMVEDGLKILIYKIPFMLQWGTPEDLEEYCYWSDYFRQKMTLDPKPEIHDMTALILMAGAGKRFADVGYRMSKPLIPVDQKPMVVSSAHSLPRASENVFVSRDEVFNQGFTFEKDIRPFFPSAQIRMLKEMTEGQASSALSAADLLEHDKPLLIEACDHHVLYNEKEFRRLSGENNDALIFTFRHFPPVRRNPCAYGWVETDESGQVQKVSVKQPLAGDPADHHAIIGSFWFREARIFIDSAKQMIAADSRINGEFYIDQAMNFVINSGFKVAVFEVDKYVSWGTPDDFKTYKYWQRFFHQAVFHPYVIEAVEMP